jgi:glycerol uptake facilitator-like aquaporin
VRARLLSEFAGTAFLLAIVAGSGIMGENLAQGNAAIALLANSLATGTGLFVLIQCLGPISGAHFNPVVSLLEMLWGRLKMKDLIPYWLAQFSGAIAGIWVAHAMFGLPLLQTSSKNRAEPRLYFSEFIATLGLLGVIALAGKKRVEWVPVAVAAYITSAYWFTSSTSFANPAVTFARAWTDTFVGIAPPAVPGFIAAQVLAGGLVYLVSRKKNSI